jgi:hypothetical protein
MVAPQWLHLTMEVDDMRTIVECSPQLGHIDNSSKRWRQFTQRYLPAAVARSHGSPQAGHSAPNRIASSTPLRVTASSGAGGRFHARASSAMKNPSVPSMLGKVVRRESTDHSGWPARNGSMTPSDSARFRVQTL